MGCYRRKVKRGIRWRFVGSYLSKPYASKAIYLTKSECADAEREYIRQADEEARKPRKEVMLIDFLNTRLDYLESKNKEYYKENKRYFKMLTDQIDDKPVHEVTKLEINKVITVFSQDLSDRKRTQHKANAMLVAFKAAFNYGIDLYELDIRNPCTGLKKKAVEKKIKFIPSDEQIKAVKEQCDEGQRLMIDFAMQTGGRIGEILRFKADDLLDREIVLYTRKSRNSDLVARKMPIPECIKGLEFKGRFFKRWTEYPRFLEKTVKELKQPFWAWHSLRHRYASRLSREGKPLFEIMLLLGHSNLDTTQRYLQLLP